MKVDIAAGLEPLKPEMSRYANSLCKALGLSVGEVDEIVQRTMVDIWQISQRDGRNPTYDKRRSAGKRVKGEKVSGTPAVTPSFEDTYEGYREYKKWVLARVSLQSKGLLRALVMHGLCWATAWRTSEHLSLR